MNCTNNWASTKKVQTFMDARKEKFGYGATKVLLK